METQEKEIIEGSLAMFNKYGIRSVTMDDVAHELGISKKTIYKFFENKADLIQKCIGRLSASVSNSFEEAMADADNAIEELFAINRIVRRILENHNPGLRFQLKKYYPEVATQLYEGRQNLLSKMIKDNIKKGQEAGLYRKDLEADIVTYLFCCKVKSMPDEEDLIAGKYSVPYVLRHSLEYHIRGMATPKGLQYLEDILSKENKEA